MRLLHSSDWHLGRSLFGRSLIEDQARALEQLVRLAAEEKVDAVLIAGDVYDRSQPPAEAVRLLDETLTELVLGKGIPVLLIAGNHDSGERLGFVSRLLVHRGLYVAGTEPLALPFEDEHGLIDIVAVPFAEPAAVAARHGDPSIADHEAAIKAELAGAAGLPALPVRGRRRAEKAAARRRVAVAHAFVAGGQTSESERPLVLGNAALVASSVFDGFSYTALGHLHRPQRVGRDSVRYSGSLLKYSFDEAAQAKSVSLVEIGADGSCRIDEVPLTLRRDLRVLEGTLDEIRRGAEADAGRDDYVMVRLQDRGLVLDAMEKVRACYPNCLRLVQEALWTSREERAASSASRRQLGEGELFESFFREVTGDAPDEAEARAFEDALAGLRREAADA